MAAKLALPEKDVVALYLKGETTVSLAARYGCSRMPISRVLEAAGVMRSLSQDNARRYGAMDESARSAQVQAAHAARRGSRDSVTTRRRRALGRQGMFCSEHERAVSAALASRGIDHVPQLAIDVFNTDLGIPMSKLAIELDGGEWHSTAKKLANDRRFEDAVTAAGWRVVRYRAGALRHPRLIAMDVERIRANPSILGCDRMVRRYVKDLIATAEHAQLAVVGPRHDARDPVKATVVRERKLPGPKKLDRNKTR